MADRFIYHADLSPPSRFAVLTILELGLDFEIRWRKCDQKSYQLWWNSLPGELTFSSENRWLRSSKPLTQPPQCRFLSMATRLFLTRARSQFILWRNTRKMTHFTRKISNWKRKSTNVYSTLAATSSQGYIRFSCLLLWAEKTEFRKSRSTKWCAAMEQLRISWTGTNTLVETKWHCPICFFGVRWNFSTSWFQSTLKNSQNSLPGWLWCENIQIIGSTRQEPMNTLRSTRKPLKNSRRLESLSCSLLKFAQNFCQHEKPQKIETRNKIPKTQKLLFSTEKCFWQEMLCRLEGMLPRINLLTTSKRLKNGVEICLLCKPKLFMLPFLIWVIVKRHFLPPQLSVAE